MTDTPDKELLAEAEQAPKLMATTGRAMAGAAAIMMITIFLARILGVVRESVTVYVFGSASMEMAAIEAALTVPNLIFYLVAGGAVRSGFVPVFTGFVAKKQYREAWGLFSNYTTFLVVVGGLVLTLCVVFARPLVHIAAPGFEGSQLDMAVQLTRWMLPVQLFLLLGGLFGGLLNTLGVFWTPALAPILYNAGIIGCVLVLSPSLGALSFAVGMLVGAVGGHFLIQLPSLFIHKIRFWPNFHWSDEGFKTVLKIAIPIIVGLTAVEINGRVNIALASWISNEAVVALGRAFRVARLPDGIFAMGVGIAMLPALSHIGAMAEMQRFRDTLATALRAIIVATVPSAALLLVLREPVMALIYQHGDKVRPEDIRLMAIILAFYALGIVPLSLRVVLTRAFYALKNSWVPAVVGCIEVVLCITLNFLTVKHFGAWGLALGTSIASLVAMVIMFWAFYKKVGPLGARRMGSGLIKTGMAAVGMSVVASFTYEGLFAVLPQGLMGMALSFLVATCLSVASYLAFCKGLGVEEINLVLSGLTRRFRPKSSTTQG